MQGEAELSDTFAHQRQPLTRVCRGFAQKDRHSGGDGNAGATAWPVVIVQIQQSQARAEAWRGAQAQPCLSKPGQRGLGLTSRTLVSAIPRARSQHASTPWKQRGQGNGPGVRVF